MRSGQANGRSHQALEQRHSVQFYGDDRFLLEDVGRFIGSALGAGDSAIVIATAAHRTGIERRLEASGLNVAQALAEERYVSLDAADTLSKFMVDGHPHAARFADVIGATISKARRAGGKGNSSRVVAFGEMVALLWAEGKPEAAIRLEQLWNELAQSISFDLHCAYPISLFGDSSDDNSMREICATHSHVVPSESFTSLATEEEKLRAIALLQQKAQALETEIEHRKSVQSNLESREAELAERNRELHAAIVVRDVFLSVAAHELKTPITSLRGFTQLLLRDARRKKLTSPERLEAALDVIECQTGKLSGLVSRLLDTAQIQAGKLRIDPVRTDLVALVRSAMQQQETSGDNKLLFRGPDSLDAVVDPVRFEQVLTNLLDNAVKFSPGGGVITVTLETAGDGGFILSVTDQGVGIPASARGEIFDRFNQVHDGLHMSGMGLGLYITREIVELHGGSIRIEEPEDGGSSFVLTFPPGR